MQAPVLVLVTTLRPPSLPLVMLERDPVLPLGRETLFSSVFLLVLVTTGKKPDEAEVEKRIRNRSNCLRRFERKAMTEFTARCLRVSRERQLRQVPLFRTRPIVWLASARADWC